MLLNMFVLLVVCVLFDRTAGESLLNKLANTGVEGDGATDILDVRSESHSKKQLTTIAVCNVDGEFGRSVGNVTITDSSTFTFLSYPAGACSNFPESSYVYGSYFDCLLIVDSFADTVGYQYSIQYQTANEQDTCCDQLSLSNSSNRQQLIFQGTGTGQGYVVGNKVYIRFSSSHHSEMKGFCLNLTALRDASQLDTTKPAVNGLCNDMRTIETILDKPTTFSVYDYNYDVCTSFPDSVYSYTSGMYCSNFVYYTEKAGNFEYKVSYDLRGKSYLAMQGWDSKVWGGKGNETGVYFSNSFSLLFVADSDETVNVGKGFCLTATPKYILDEPTEADWTHTAGSTYGLCARNSSTSYQSVTIDKTSTFTFVSYPIEACYNFPDSSYNYSMYFSCELVVNSFEDTVGYQYSIQYQTATEKDYCCDSIILSNSSSDDQFMFAGVSSSEGYVVGKQVYIKFKSGSYYGLKGFCLQITPIRDPNQLILTEPQVHGICDGIKYNTQEVLLGGSKTLAVYNSDYSVCINFPNWGINYTSGLYCPYNVMTRYPAVGYNYEISYDFGGESYFSVFANTYKTWSGSGRDSGYIDGTSMNMYFAAEVDRTADIGKGFCMTVTPTRNIDMPTNADWINSTGPTFGLCNVNSASSSSSSEVIIGGKSTFTFATYPIEACSDFPDSSYYYGEDFDCSYTVHSLDGTIGFNYSIKYETEDCCDYVRLSNNTQADSALTFKGTSQTSGYLQGKTAYIRFNSDSSVVKRGFCLVLIPVSK